MVLKQLECCHKLLRAILREDTTVTHHLHNIFPFWKEGWPMVQFDNAYAILEDDIQFIIKHFWMR